MKEGDGGVCKHCRGAIVVTIAWSGLRWRHLSSGKYMCPPVTVAEPFPNTDNSSETPSKGN